MWVSFPTQTHFLSPLAINTTLTMSDRGRSRSPKPLSPSPNRDRDISMSRSRSPRKPDSNADIKGNGTSTGFRVVVVGGLTKNVHRGHLEEIFTEYGRVTGCDLPVFKVCKSV